MVSQIDTERTNYQITEIGMTLLEQMPDFFNQETAACTYYLDLLMHALQAQARAEYATITRPTGERWTVGVHQKHRNMLPAGSFSVEIEFTSLDDRTGCRLVIDYWAREEDLDFSTAQLYFVTYDQASGEIRDRMLLAQASGYDGKK